MTQDQYTRAFQVVQDIKDTHRSIGFIKDMMDRNAKYPLVEGKGEWYKIAGPVSNVLIEPRLATEVLRLLLKLKEDLLTELETQFADI